MTEKEKQNLIKYMVKHCGLTPHNARRRFETWESVRADKSVLDNIKKKKIKKSVVEDKKMTVGQIRTMVLYMHRHGYIISWIANSLGISENEVNYILTKFRKSL